MKRFEEIKKLHEDFACGHEEIDDLIQMVDLLNKRNSIENGNIKELEQEKEKNKEIEEYANWHIEHTTEDIADYIDDDRKANASIIVELKEEREHWKDIIRIINNEKLILITRIIRRKE